MEVLIFLFGTCIGGALTILSVVLMRYVNKKNRRKKRGFTDKMYIFNVAFVTTTVITSFIAMFLSGRLGITDLSSVTVIVPSAFTELGLHTGFVIWKAKSENCRKYPRAQREVEECTY